MLPPREKLHRLPEERYFGRVSVAFTLCTENRFRLFEDSDVVQILREKLFDHATRKQSITSLYCFMPDHLHAVIFGQSDDARPKTAMNAFKTSSGIWLKRHRPQARWQDGYHDRIIRDHHEWRGHVRYVLNNPVRAGLVSKFEDYPYIGCQGMSIKELLEGW